MAMKKPKRPPERHPISITKGGRTYHGSYTVEGDFVIVISDTGREKGTQIGNSSPEKVAEMMLNLLVSDFRNPAE